MHRRRAKLHAWIQTSTRIGLHINTGKTKIRRTQHASNGPVTVAGQPLEEVNAFTYLGSMVATQGGSDADVRARTGTARTAFLILKIWSSREIGKSIKMRIFTTNVKSVPLWRTFQATLHKLQTFNNSCLLKNPLYPVARED